MKMPDERKEFLQKLRMAASEADDLLTSCDASDLLDGLEVARDFMFEAASLIEELESRLVQVERERGAAAKIIEDATTYLEDFGSGRFALMQLKKWNGQRPENTKEDSK